VSGLHGGASAYFLADADHLRDERIHLRRRHLMKGFPEAYDHTNLVVGPVGVHLAGFEDHTIRTNQPHLECDRLVDEVGYPQLLIHYRSPEARLSLAYHAVFYIVK